MALISAFGISASCLAYAPTILEKVIRGKTSSGTSDKKTTVPKRSINPVNIPVSTSRFRPNVEANDIEIFCFYWQRSIVLAVSSYHGEVRVLIKSPDDRTGKLYRLAGGRSLVFPVSGVTGDYTVEVATSLGERCVFDFELTD